MIRAIWSPMLGAALAAWTGAAWAQAALCQDPARFCGAGLDGACLSRLGAGAAAADAPADCRAQLDRYLDCVARAAEQCGGGPPETAAAGCDSDTARDLWALAERDNDCAAFQTFLRACPNTPRAAFAQDRMRRLGCGGDARPLPAAPLADLGRRAVALLQLQNGVFNATDTRGVARAGPEDFTFFARDSAEISAEAALTLMAQAARAAAFLSGRRLQGVRSARLQLIGHCATDQPRALDLCGARADAVKARLLTLGLTERDFAETELLGSQAMLAYGPALQGDPVNRYVWTRMLE